MCKMVEYWDVYDENGNKTGRLHERGKPMRKGEYHLVVHVWILNKKREFLITKRAPGTGDIADLWQTTGGCAVSGDNSLTTVLKETAEETGIVLNPDNGRLLKRFTQAHFDDDGHSFCDVWLFKQDFNISSVVLQPGETCGAMWANSKKIIEMMNDGIFIPIELYPYIYELFENPEVK